MGREPEFNSRFCGTAIDLMAPPNDSDNRSEAEFVGSGGKISSTGGAVGSGGGAGAAFLGGGVTTAFFLVIGGTGFFFVVGGTGFGAKVDTAGNEISATSIVRNGCSISD